MTLNRILFLLMFIISLSGCKNNKEETNHDEQNKSIPGDYFENQEAEKLNEQGIEMTKNGDYKGGKSSFLKSLKIEPNNPTALSNLGLNRYLVNDYESAKEYYQKSYKISDSTYHIAALNLGLTYFYSRESDKGIEIMNYVIQHTEDKGILSSAYVHRALNYLGNDQCEKAQIDLNYIIDNFQGIGNTAYHIKDLTKKIKQCFQFRG